MYYTVIKYDWHLRTRRKYSKHEPQAFLECSQMSIIILLNELILIYVYIIDQVRGQDGWILVEFSFCVFMDRDEVEVHENAKRERGQYPAILTELAWSIKDLLYGIKSAEKNDLRTCLFSSTEKEPS